jgi:hypothetical protein
VFVVGNQPDDDATPVVGLIVENPIPVCEQPTPEPQPQGDVVEARPTFTG